jgi:hypothetical protein
MRFAVIIGIAGRVADGVSAGGRGLRSLAGGFAKGFESGGEISGAILIGGELLLKRA